MSENAVKREHKIFCVSLFFCSLLYLIFYMRMAATEGDIMAHEWVSRTIFEETVVGPTQALSYPLYHYVLHGIAWILQGNYLLAAALLLTASNVAVILLFRWILDRIFPVMNLTQRFVMDVVCLFSSIFMDIVGPLTEGRFYQGQCGPNPVQNPTIIFVKPFGLLTFYLFIRMYEKMWKGEKCFQYALGYTVLLLLGALAKPSAAFVLLPAFAIMTVILMWQKKSLIPGIKILFETLPTAVLLIWQFCYYFLDRISFFEFLFGWLLKPMEVEAAEMMVTGITAERTAAVLATDISFQFVWGSFYGFHTIQVILVTIAACLIPMISVLCFQKGKKERYHLFLLVALLSLAAGWIEMFCMSNGAYGDFSWGYDIAVQLATILGLAAIWMKAEKNWIRYLSLAVYAYQAGCGIVYMILVYRSGEFWF